MIFRFDGHEVHQEEGIKSSDDVNDIRFSPNGKYVTLGSGKSKVNLFSWDTK